MDIDIDIDIDRDIDIDIDIDKDIDRNIYICTNKYTLCANAYPSGSCGFTILQYGSKKYQIVTPQRRHKRTNAAC